MFSMIDGFEHLSPEEFDTVTEAPALIAILVGGADGDLDHEERNWSEHLLRTRAYNKPKELNEFYRVISETFWVKVNALMRELPGDPETRGNLISERLSRLNPVFAKLDLQIAAGLYRDFRKLAMETAVASGGFLRMGAVSGEEARWVELPMLTPVAGPEKPVEPEEEEDDN